MARGKGEDLIHIKVYLNRISSVHRPRPNPREKVYRGEGGGKEKDNAYKHIVPAEERDGTCLIFRCANKPAVRAI